ncbi:hypothetical protein [Undibacter mobilis]|uniref:hypothetical protein n=1 Tax=Undibacter mobilis TaxID=2292256 RepID=UPI00143D1F5F|nr:hypothetical protein [Undibacter mobilis]
MSDTSTRPLMLNDGDVERFRSLWDAGIASGCADEADFPALRAEARKRLADEKRSPDN